MVCFYVTSQHECRESEGKTTKSSLSLSNTESFEQRASRKLYLPLH